MTAAILSIFGLALGAPYIHRMARKKSGWVLAVLPLAWTLYFVGKIGRIASGEVISVSQAWVPTLGINLSFLLDGLSLMFALIICGIGVLVVVYSGGYLAGHPQQGRFYAFLLLFMGSMLGVVLADNAITLFVFWELTSISSYLLIGFDHERKAARAAALQALLVTGLGGLPLLAAFLMLGRLGGSLELSGWMANAEAVRASPLYVPILLLVLVGAFTKSAQVPFHFWLPNAMEAPSPVSAYLHAATMVKAGVYLLARLSPLLGGTAAWVYIVSAVGAMTMFAGAYLAYQNTDLKRILAYSTVSTLGTLTLLLGLGTTLAVQAAVLLLFAHALYKGALFLVAGSVEHETGCREITGLGRLRRAMPVTAAAAGIAALSMAGLPPLLGFLGKEVYFEALWDSQQAALILLAVAVLTAMLTLAVAGAAGVRPFIGEAVPTPKSPREVPASLWLGPVILSGLGMIFGVIPGLLNDWLFSPASSAILGRPAPIHLALWHGFTPVLGLSALSIAGGLTLYAAHDRLREVTGRFRAGFLWGPARWYDLSLEGLDRLAPAVTRRLQSGYLRVYLLTIIATTVALAGYTLVSRVSWAGAFSGPGVHPHEAVLAGLIMAAALAAVHSKSRLGAVATLGVVGYGVALVYILFGAPDLAMTQVMVETLTVILFVLMFYHLPRFAEFTARPARARDIVVALATGGLVTALVLAATRAPLVPRLSPYFAEKSLADAHGRNIVNVILVDFRGLDTLGEITVLSVAGMGVYALLKLRIQKEPEK
ncbi:MAG: putative monovalent cation/H+ antiporter subunit A [Acidobacteria bacterium]|nr:putative monovalent cation/H+ antiporter subunit A [Acidobacteriota bacterium]